ncbi:ribonuclease III [Methylobacterium oxalidis]|uniref:Ribonuclease 3 n=1 Tax=Methylobacterium oxalidis TaxID=944322 RepID=A0A512J499_9HYPH|nr:ribonuclease III [Methylobacterium oxalidis]GEP04679.1 ribonuclease 3 [Methylobacterium oxalidis]GJE32751.1 Ribonuclease 3 [Methylobacterium oxalidis]GLS63266.1 ribonuclease 3 [Methylobacterium oxalidis]
MNDAARPSSRARRAHRPKPPLSDLEERLGHAFADQELLTRALTHVSKATGRTGSYQRLEFLGDRVLGLAIADLLYRAFPEADEGELSRRLAGLVRRETCAAVATAWDVGPHLVLGPGEVMGGGRRNQTILADVCESILGAVFLDAGFGRARDLVEAAFRPGEKTGAPRGRDAKSALQEWAMGRGLPIPVYEVVERSGPDHAPRFRIAVRVEGVEPGYGEGTSKRLAEQEAARSVLAREGIGAGAPETNPPEAG